MVESKSAALKREYQIKQMSREKKLALIQGKKMKYRGNSKIKREHSMLKGLDKVLEDIEHWEEIAAIIPGRIKDASNMTEPHLTVQYQTETGVKCLFKSNGIQECFFVSDCPEQLIERLKKL